MKLTVLKPIEPEDLLMEDLVLKAENAVREFMIVN